MARSENQPGRPTHDGHDEFLRLFSQHSRRVYEFIATLIVNTADVEEVFQETCVVLWKKFGDYDPEGSFPAWACKIAYFEVLHLRRANGRLKIFSDEVLALIADHMLASSEQLASRREALEDCLERLDAEDRDLIHRRYYLQEQTREIAQNRSMSLHAVYRCLSRLHMRLRDCVGRAMAKEGAL